MSETRRAWVLWVAVAVAAALVVALAVGVVSWRRSSGAGEELDRAVTLIESADKLVVQVDEVIRTQVTSDLAGPAAEAQTQAAQAVGILNSAVRAIDEAASDLSGDNVARATDLKLAATARLRMLAQAPAILDATAKAASALPVATDAWQRVLEADKRSDRAVAAYNRLTDTGVRESQRLNKQVATELSAAREGFVQAEAAFPEADFEAYLSYVDLRVQLNGLSQRSDADWLAGELEKANAAIASYNELDARAVSAAKQLPTSPAQAVADAYAAVADAATDEYYAARAEATDADERLRGR